MSILKELRLPVEARWNGEGRVSLSARDLTPLLLAPPPEVYPGRPARWSAEELLVGAVAASFAAAVAAVAERLALPLESLHVTGDGHVCRRTDGRLGFSVVELHVELETTPDALRSIDELIELARERCVVARALHVPLHVTTQATAPGFATVAAGDVS